MEDNKSYRKILFWVFTCFFIIITSLTILNLFFGIGILEKEYKSSLVTAFIMEIAAGLIALFYMLFGIKKVKEAEVSSEKPELLPARKGITEEEISIITEKKSAEIYVAPDRSYTIIPPPKDWKIKEDSKLNLTIENLQIRNQDYINHLKKSLPDLEDVVVFESPKKFTVIPKPGETIMNGSMLPTALSFKVGSQLVIFPENCYRPPLYTYSPMQNVLLETLTANKLLSILDIRKINTFVVKETNVKITEIELAQNIQNCILDDNEFSAFEIHHHYFGIEGGLKHYILQVSYIETFGVQNEAANDKSILFGIVNSFRPLQLINSQSIKEKEKKEALNKHLNILKTASPSIFIAELGQFLVKFSVDDDFDSKEKLDTIIKGLRQFKLLAKQIDLKDDSFNELWGFIDKAEQGNMDEFKENFRSALKNFNDGILEKANEGAIAETSALE